MVNILILFVALFASTLTLMLSVGMLGTLLGLRMTLEGFTHLQTGTVLSGFYLGLVIGSFICPSVVRRTGHIRSFAVFAAINTATALVYPMLVCPSVWFPARILSGISMMGIYMVVESWLNDQTEAQMRGRVFSVYMAICFLGLGFGQFLLNLGDIRRDQLFLIVGMLSVISLIPVSMTRSLSPKLPETTSLKLRDLSHRAPMGLLGAFTSGIIAAAFYSLAPVYASQSGMNLQNVTLFMGATIISGFLMQWPVGSLSDHFDRQKVLAVLALMIGASSIFLILTTSQEITLRLLAGSLYGGLAFTLYPIYVAHTNDRIENTEIVAASAALILFYGLGACIGPVAAALCIKFFGPDGLFILTSSTTALFLIAVCLYIYFEKPKKEKMVPFVPVPRTSPVISSLHPHVEE